MSCSWDVYCQDCGDGMGLDFNYGEEWIRAVIKGASVIAAIADLPGFRVEDDCGSALVPSWLKKHLGHRLIARNEYGQFDDGCDIRHTCECCGYNFHCKLVKGHEGQHLPARR